VGIYAHIIRDTFHSRDVYHRSYPAGKLLSHPLEQCSLCDRKRESAGTKDAPARQERYGGIVNRGPAAGLRTLDKLGILAWISEDCRRALVEIKIYESRLRRGIWSWIKLCLLYWISSETWGKHLFIFIFIFTVYGPLRHYRSQQGDEVSSNTDYTLWMKGI
jgi:hypothetical protein